MPRAHVKPVYSVLLVLLACAVVVSVPRAGEAPRTSSDLTYQFEGTITWINDFDGYVGNTVTKGDQFTGSFTINTAAAAFADGLDFAQYRSVGEPYGLSVQLDGLYFGSNPDDRRTEALVHNNVSARDFFSVSAQAYDYGSSMTNPAIDNRQYVLFGFMLPRQCDGNGSAIHKYIMAYWTDAGQDAIGGLGIPINLDAIGEGPGKWDAAGISIQLATPGFFGGAPYPNQQCLVYKTAAFGGDFTRVWLVQADTAAPEVTCNGPDGQWHGSDVAITCTAADGGSGLANSNDASFVLVTSVADGTETADAPTTTRQVCDQAGNCATAGPIAGNKVDKKAPVITLNAPGNGPYIMGQAVTANYACSDGGSGTALCAGPVASGATVSTAAVGPQTFLVTATDAVGNTSTRSADYGVNYNICPLYDSTKARQSGSTIPIKVQLCDAGGRNVSAASAVVTAVGIYLVSTQVSGALEDSGNANPDFNFRFTGDSYIFNLSLKGFREGVYALTFKVGEDPTLYSVQFQVR